MLPLPRRSADMKARVATYAVVRLIAICRCHTDGSLSPTGPLIAKPPAAATSAASGRSSLPNASRAARVVSAGSVRSAPIPRTRAPPRAPRQLLRPLDHTFVAVEQHELRAVTRERAGDRFTGLSRASVLRDHGQP